MKLNTNPIKLKSGIKVKHIFAQSRSIGISFHPILELDPIVEYFAMKEIPCNADSNIVD
jgi:hypothetical protein